MGAVGGDEGAAVAQAGADPGAGGLRLRGVVEHAVRAAEVVDGGDAAREPRLQGVLGIGLDGRPGDAEGAHRVDVGVDVARHDGAPGAFDALGVGGQGAAGGDDAVDPAPAQVDVAVLEEALARRRERDRVDDDDIAQGARGW